MTNLEASAMAQDRRPRDDYPVRMTLTTRWADNDVYGHVNNVVYYAYFDTVVNRYLIEQQALDIHQGDVIGLVVQSHCEYHAPLAFPRPVVAGLGVDRLGRSSVAYRIALFDGDETTPAAEGGFVHVYVDRQTRRPVALPPRLREVLTPLVWPTNG